jgi:DnaJ-class molecular chaperone
MEHIIVFSDIVLIFKYFSAVVHLVQTARSTPTNPNHYILLGTSFNEIMSTHYEVVNVSRFACMSEIKAAYHRILLQSRPDRTHMLDPFTRSQADQEIREANAAWEVLSTPATKMAYDVSLPPLSGTGFGDFSSSGNKSNQSKKSDHMMAAYRLYASCKRASQIR